MERIVLAAIFFISAILLPWWVTATFAVLLIARHGAWPEVLLGGLLMDLVFGAPIARLGGFAYLYTAFFMVLVLLARELRQRMLE